MPCKDAILSEDYYDFILDSRDENAMSSECSLQVEPFFECVYRKAEDSPPLLFDNYSYNSIPKCFSLLDTDAMQDAGILQVQNYPTLELQGSGVLIGFIDTGIDYTNEIFRNLDRSTRILGIWDQTIQNGPAPAGMEYGTEYLEEQINEALRNDMPFEIIPARDEIGHGTFLASLAAGGPQEEEQFIGAAPDCRIAMVKLKEAKQYLKDYYLIGTENPCYQENDIMLGISYLNQLADRYGLPLVLCIALGTNQGSHSGSSPLAGILDVCANRSSRAVVIGAGNEAAERHHYLGKLGANSETDEIEVRVEEGNTGFALELWTDPFQLVQVAVESPSGERTYPFSLRQERTVNYTFVLERTILSVDYKVFTERLDGELVFFRFRNPTEGIWKVIVEPVRVTGGQYHMWLPVESFLQRKVYFLESNADYTVTEPGSTLSGMTVGFYDGENNSVAIQSGRGYTRSMRIKPDFVAPGVNVRGLAARGLYVERTGSSIAAGITAGAAALIMEWVVYRLREDSIASTQIRDLLVLGTEQKRTDSYPNREWGYGTLNVYNTFESLRQIS